MNDDKPTGLKMAHALNMVRDDYIDVCVLIDKYL